MSAPPAPSPPDALSRLRAATRAEHDRIEAVLRLTEPMPLARYTAVMQGFHAFLSAWEPRMDAALPPDLREWFAPRRRAGLARADLDALGAVLDPAAEARARRAVEGLPLDSLPAAIGSLYVLEGSVLGGRVIAPRLAETLGLRPGAGAAYFHGFGDAAGAMWREFRQRAEAALTRGDPAVDAACDSARATFAAMVAVFEPLVAAPSPRPRDAG